MNIDFLSKKEQIALRLEGLYSHYGYEKYHMNKFEAYSFYLEKEKFLEDNRVLIFNSPSGKLLALKPDITMSVLKSCSGRTGGNRKMYYNESVFRIPKGQVDFQEIQQIGVESIGEIDSGKTLEVLDLAVKSLELLGGNTLLCVSSMGLLLHILGDLDLSLSQRNRILHYIKQKNLHDLEKYFTKEGITGVEPLFLLLSTPGELEKAIAYLWAVFVGTAYEEELGEMITLLSHLSALGGKIQFDFSYITSTEYYNGLVFVGYVEGNSVPALTGGRYDGLAKKMGLSSALGFAVNLSAIN